MVVDRDMQVLPTRTPRAVDAVFADALADLPEAPELLRIHVQELAGTLALVAHAPIARRPRQARAASSPQHLADGRGWPFDDGGDHRRTRSELSAPAQDLTLGRGREPARLVLGGGGAIGERCVAALAEATPQPVARRSARPAGGRGRLRALSIGDQRHDPAARLEREAHPPGRAHSIMHLGLLCELGLGRPQGSREARTRSGVSQVCG